MYRSFTHTYQALFRTFLIMAVASTMIACLPPSETSGGGGGDALTQETFQEANVDGSALDAVRALRPTWLNTRGDVSANAIQVYVDGTRQAGSTTSILDSFPIDSVKRMWKISPQQAVSRYGSGHEEGAIFVVTQ